MSRIKVLLVDDDADFADVMTSRLAMRDLKSRAARSGDEALRLVRDDPPDVMVVDLRTPGIDGMRLLEHVKAEHPGVEVVILAGHGSEEAKREARRLGAAAYFQKPVGTKQLLDAIHAAWLKGVPSVKDMSRPAGGAAPEGSGMPRETDPPHPRMDAATGGAGAPVQRAGASEEQLVAQRRYRRILWAALPAVSAVAVVPLLIMAALNFHQYQEAAVADVTRPMLRFTAAAQQSTQSYFSEHLSALAMAVRQESYADLRDQRKLDSLLSNLRQTFGGFVDLGLIDDKGVQLAYAGPFELRGRPYADQTWFRQVSLRGECVSDAFLGYRRLRHIVVAVQARRPGGHWFVLRGTIDADAFHWPTPTASGDAFMLNRSGVLQTPSRLLGHALAPSGLPPLPYSADPRVVEVRDARGTTLLVSYAAIARSPYTLVVAAPASTLPEGWSATQRRLLLMPALASLIIFALVVGGTVWAVNWMREDDLRRTELCHKMEHTNRLAAIGRLSASVAQQVNTPLTIVAEKAARLKEVLTRSSAPPPHQDLVELADALQQSAARCGGVTRRLLSFAHQVEEQWETIELDPLLREVLALLDQETGDRAIQVAFEPAEEPTPPIVSDRGRLQQVFLNVLNNACAAVDDGGRITIAIRRAGADAVAVSIADNGVGIPKEHLARIFDPFFTTKPGAGTGLGLAVTHEMVEKLGGRISVESEVGRGARFTVTLPLGVDRG